MNVYFLILGVTKIFTVCEGALENPSGLCLCMRADEIHKAGPDGQLL